MSSRHSFQSQGVNPAEVEGFIAGYFGVASTTPGISDLARVVFPGVQAATRGNPAGWRSVVPGVLSNHIGLAQGLGLGATELQKQLDIMRHSNRTSAEFAQALGRVQALVAGMGGWHHVATAVEAGLGSHPSSMARAIGLSGPYSEHTLSSELRSLNPGYSAKHIADVGNYVNGLGITDVNHYSRYFVGSSEEVRRAIRDHVSSGKAITDDAIKSSRDASAVIGAIKAGKMKEEDAPPSVQKIMKDMREKGIDPAKSNPEAIKGYFDKNPKALEEAKKAAKADVAVQNGKTKNAKIASQEDAADNKGVIRPGEKTRIGKLELGG